MNLKGAYDLISKHEEKYHNKMKDFISVNQQRFEDQQKVLSKNSKIETPKKLPQKKRAGSKILGDSHKYTEFLGNARACTRDELNSDLRIAEFKNYQLELGSEFAEYFSKLDVKIIIKNEKVRFNIIYLKNLTESTGRFMNI